MDDVYVREIDEDKNIFSNSALLRFLQETY